MTAEPSLWVWSDDRDVEGNRIMCPIRVVVPLGDGAYLNVYHDGSSFTDRIAVSNDRESKRSDHGWMPIRRG